MVVSRVSLSFLLSLLLPALAVADSTYLLCDDHPNDPPETELKLEYIATDGTVHSDKIFGLSPHESQDLTVSGQLVRPLPASSTGCSVDSYGQTPNKPWLAIIERGICTFREKEMVAQRLGAVGMIVYQIDDSQLTVMKSLANNISSVMIPRLDGIKYSLLLNTTSIYATLSRKTDQPHSSTNNNLLLVFTSLMSPVALLLNTIAAIAIICYPEKPKPYLYFIANLVVTDLMAAVIGTTMILLMYKSFDGDKSRVDDSTLYRTCTAIILTDLWDVSVLSNLLTLLSLTAEHFIAFRWPLKHKLWVTKQRVMVVIALSWLVASIPFIANLIGDALAADVPDCVSDKGFCHRLYYIASKEVNDDSGWVLSLVWTIVILIVFFIMVIVYGYIITIINRVSVRNPGFRKKRSAVITTLCLIISFIVSYIFYFIQHFYVVFEQKHDTALLREVSKLLSGVCPACHLMLDFLFTGMIGAIMDPIIYCARMKEVKSALSRLLRYSKFNRRPSVTSTTLMKTTHPSIHSEEEPL